MKKSYYMVGYTDYNRKGYTVEYWENLKNFEIEAVGTVPWSCNTSFWIIPGTIDVND